MKRDLSRILGTTVSCSRGKGSMKYMYSIRPRKVNGSYPAFSLEQSSILAHYLKDNGAIDALAQKYSGWEGPSLRHQVTFGFPRLTVNI